MLLIKFGKREHLEQLKKGIVHLSPIETYQNDPSAFRGDEMEGKFFLDLSKPFLINGMDVSHLLKSVTLTYDMVLENGSACTTLSFSASKLTKSNCHEINDKLYAVNDDYYEEMKQFGDSFFIFNVFDFMDELKAECQKADCGFECHSMTYRDKNNHDEVRAYFDSLTEDRKQLGHLFLKDCTNSYPLQAEWRAILLDYHNHFTLDKNGAANVQTGFKSKMPVFDIAELKSLQCSEEYLFDR